MAAVAVQPLVQHAALKAATAGRDSSAAAAVAAAQLLLQTAAGEGLPVLLDAWNQISTWQLNRRAFVAAVVARLTLAAAASHTAALGWLLWQLHTARLLLLEELLEKVEEAPQLINNVLEALHTASAIPTASACSAPQSLDHAAAQHSPHSAHAAACFEAFSKISALMITTAYSQSADSFGTAFTLTAASDSVGRAAEQALQQLRLAWFQDSSYREAGMAMLEHVVNIAQRQVFPRACAYRYLVAITTYLLRLPDNQLATPPLSRSLTPTCSPACAAALLAMMCAVHPVKIVGIVHQAVLGGCLNWSVALPLLDQMVQHCPGSCSPLQSMVEDVQSAAFEAHSTSQFSAVLLIRRHVPLEALSAACPSPLSHYAAWLQKLLLGAPGEDGSLSGGVAYHAKGLQLVKATVQGMVETDALNVLEAHRKAFKEAKKLALGARQREAVDDYLTIVEPYIHELQPQATESERALALLQQPAPSAEAMAAAQQLLDAFARSPHDAEAHFRHIYTWKKPEYARLLAALQYPCADAREVGERLAFLQAMHRAKPFSLVKGSDVADFQSACAELQRTFGGRAPSAALRGALAGTSQGLLSVIEGVVDAISNASPSVALEVLQRMDRAVGKELDAGQQGKPHALPASIITEHLITAFGVSFASTGPNHRAWCLPFVAVLHGHAALHAALLPRLRRLVNEHCLRDALTPEQVSGLAGLLMFMATSQHASRGDKQTTPCFVWQSSSSAPEQPTLHSMPSVPSMQNGTAFVADLFAKAWQAPDGQLLCLCRLAGAYIRALDGFSMWTLYAGDTAAGRPSQAAQPGSQPVGLAEAEPGSWQAGVVTNVPEQLVALLQWLSERLSHGVEALGRDTLSADAHWCSKVVQAVLRGELGQVLTHASGEVSLAQYMQMEAQLACSAMADVLLPLQAALSTKAAVAARLGTQPSVDAALVQSAQAVAAILTAVVKTEQIAGAGGVTSNRQASHGRQSAHSKCSSAGIAADAAAQRSMQLQSLLAAVQDSMLLKLSMLPMSSSAATHPADDTNTPGSVPGGADKHGMHVVGVSEGSEPASKRARVAASHQGIESASSGVSRYVGRWVDCVEAAIAGSMAPNNGALAVVPVSGSSGNGMVSGRGQHARGSGGVFGADINSSEFPQAAGLLQAMLHQCMVQRSLLGCSTADLSLIVQLVLGRVKQAWKRA